MKKILFVIILLLLCISNEKRVIADNNPQRFVLVLVPDLSFREIEWFLEYGESDLWNQGSLGAVNQRTEGSYSYLNHAVTLSAGVRGVGVHGWNAYELEERLDNGTNAKQRYLQWTGKNPDGGIVHPYYHKLVRNNLETTYKAQIGLLGEMLKQNNVHRFVLGHSDLTNEKIRYGSLFTIDQEGATDGILTNSVKEKFASPHGMEMDSDQIITNVGEQEQSNENVFTVIEWGDLHRLFSQKEQMVDEYYHHQYKQQLLALEKFLSKIVNEEDRQVMLLSPVIQREAYQKKERLGPVWIWRSPLVSADGLHAMTSATTRQRHVISNVDVAPTILNFFGVAYPNVFLGHPLQVDEERQESATSIVRHVQWLFTIFSSRGVVLSSYITLLVMMLLAVSLFIWRNKGQSRWIQSAKVLLVSGVSSPMWFLLTPYLLKYLATGHYFWILSLSSLLTGFILVKLSENPFIIIGWAHFLLITVDLYLGAPLMQRSYLGYDPVIGARYYGIGNEYAGVYVISGLLVLIPFINKKQKLWMSGAIVAMAVIQLYILGSSHLGTNAGATLAAAVAFVYLLFRVWRLSLNRMMLAVIIVVALLSSFLLLYVLQRTQQTHIGYAFERLLNADFHYIKDVIERKLQMNWKIFRFSNWTQLFVTTYLLSGLYLWRQKKFLTQQPEKEVVQSGIVASIALLLLNDSGVVAAATSMFLIVSASYFWALERKDVR